MTYPIGSGSIDRELSAGVDGDASIAGALSRAVGPTGRSGLALGSRSIPASGAGPLARGSGDLGAPVSSVAHGDTGGVVVQERASGEDPAPAAGISAGPIESDSSTRGSATVPPSEAGASAGQPGAPAGTLRHLRRASRPSECEPCAWVRATVKKDGRRGRYCEEHWREFRLWLMESGKIEEWNRLAANRTSSTARAERANVYDRFERERWPE